MKINKPLVNIYYKLISYICKCKYKEKEEFSRTFLGIYRLEENKLFINEQRPSLTNFPDNTTFQEYLEWLQSYCTTRWDIYIPSIEDLLENQQLWKQESSFYE